MDNAELYGNIKPTTLSQLLYGANRHYVNGLEVMPDYRYGQALYNYTRYWYPEVVAYCPRESDCFNRDDRMGKFLRFVLPVFES